MSKYDVSEIESEEEKLRRLLFDPLKKSTAPNINFNFLFSDKTVLGVNMERGSGSGSSSKGINFFLSQTSRFDASASLNSGSTSLSVDRVALPPYTIKGVDMNEQGDTFSEISLKSISDDKGNSNTQDDEQNWEDLLLSFALPVAAGLAAGSSTFSSLNGLTVPQRIVVSGSSFLAAFYVSIINSHVNQPFIPGKGGVVLSDLKDWSDSVSSSKTDEVLPNNTENIVTVDFGGRTQITVEDKGYGGSTVTVSKDLSVDLDAEGTHSLNVAINTIKNNTPDLYLIMGSDGRDTGELWDPKERRKLSPEEMDGKIYNRIGEISAKDVNSHLELDRISSHRIGTISFIPSTENTSKASGEIVDINTISNQIRESQALELELTGIASKVPVITVVNLDKDCLEFRIQDGTGRVIQAPYGTTLDLSLFKILDDAIKGEKREE